MLWDSIETTSVATTAFYSSTSINDFSVDFNGNIWVLFDSTKYVKYTNDRKFVLSGSLPNDNYVNYKIDFEAVFENGEYNKYAVIAGQDILAGKTIIFYKINLETGELIKSNIINSSVLFANGLTNANFLRSFIRDKYNTPQLNAKATLVNTVDQNDVITSEIKFDLTSLDPGYHSFAIRFDSNEGKRYMFVDGQYSGYGTNNTLGYDEFTPKKYRLNNIINKPFLYGSSSYAFSIPLYSYLKNSSFLANNITLKNIYIYNKALYDFDIIFHARQNMNIEDIRFDVACGRRNYLEEIERYFRLSTPPSKSTLFNLILRNSNITDLSLRSELEKRIVNIINNTAPVYSKLNKIIWSN
jgi:hypothetical protein